MPAIASISPTQRPPKPKAYPRLLCLNDSEVVVVLHIQARSGVIINGERLGRTVDVNHLLPDFHGSVTIQNDD